MIDVQTDYVIDTPYTWDFFPTLSPTILRYVALLRGAPAPDLSKAFNFCELGCGNGLTSNVLAACFPQSTFIAVDLNPQHIANGQKTAQHCGIENIEFLNRRFDALLGEDLPMFDVVALHGVYTWVTPTVRQDILRVLGRFLKPTGLVYVSYNAMPGWAPLLPIRHVLARIADHTPGSSLDKAARGLEALKLLRDLDAGYFRRNPSAATFFDELLDDDPAYVAHEYLNPTFEPLYFTEVADDFAKAGLVYCGSADIECNHENLVVPPRFLPSRKVLRGEQEYEICKSLALNERFRRDIYCRTSAYEPEERQAARFADQVFGNPKGAEAVAREATVGGRKIRFKGELLDALIPEIAIGRLSVAELCERPSMRRFDPETIMRAIHSLVAGKQLWPFVMKAPTLAEGPYPNVRISSPINRALLRARLFTEDSCILASPTLGNGVQIAFESGLLLLALDATDPERATEYALAMLEKTGRKWTREGQGGVDPTVQRVAVTDRLQNFFSRDLPTLRRAGIVELA